MTSWLNRLVALRRTIRGLSSESWFVSLAEAKTVLDPPGAFGSLFLSHEGPAVDKWLHFFEAYDEEFGRYRDGFRLPNGDARPVRMLEIGVQHGGSLHLWRKFFGPEAEIWGVDIDPRCAEVGGTAAKVRIGSQADPDFLRSVVEEMGGLDIVLDDGSHVASHQLASFKTLFPLLSEGGVYAAEDLHTAYWRDFGGGYRAPASFIEVTKALVDDLHRPYHRRKDRVGVEAASSISRIATYDSMVFIRKRATLGPRRTVVGTPSF